MGHSDSERRRLIEQVALFRPYTGRLFDDCGIVPGMRVLDVGCGVGDVSLLAASLVGQHGEVVGVDTDVGSLTLARRRAAAGISTVSFIEADLRALPPLDPSMPSSAGSFSCTWPTRPEP